MDTTDNKRTILISLSTLFGHQSLSFHAHARTPGTPLLYDKCFTEEFVIVLSFRISIDGVYSLELSLC